MSQLAFRGLDTATQGINKNELRGVAVINDEAIRENGDENLNLAGSVDISDRSGRAAVTFPPKPALESGIEDFTKSRCSARITTITRTPSCLEDARVAIDYFNAGARYDNYATTPPKSRVFSPEDPTKRIGTKPGLLITVKILADRRDYLSKADKTHGIDT